MRRELTKLIGNHVTTGPLDLAHWPLEEQNACSSSQTDRERNKMVLRRMNNWTAEIEVCQLIEI